MLFFGSFGFDNADAEEAGRISGAKDTGGGGGPVDHVGAGLEGALTVAAAIVGDDKSLSGNGVGVAGAFDGEGGEGGEGGR